MRTPQPPLGNSNEDLHKGLSDEINYRNYLFFPVLKLPQHTQAIIDTLTSLDFVGSLVFNTTLNAPMIGELNTLTNTTKWRAF